MKLVAKTSGLLTRREALLALAAAPAALALPVSEGRFEFTQPCMGTHFRMVLYAPDGAMVQQASAAAFQRVAALDACFSDYRENSELMRLCHAPGGPAVAVSEDMFRILTEAQRVAVLSGGAFDVTVGPLVQLWRRARRTGALPDPSRLRQALALVGQDKLQLDASTRTVRLEKPGMLLDLGGIAKGYAAEEALSVLRGVGIRSALVAGGGDIVAGDAPPGRTGWSIEVQPMPGNRAISVPPLSLSRAAVSTSGDAEQHVEIGGIRYSHIVDPRTGKALTGRRGITVVAANGTWSDALATAATVLGPKRGLQLVDSVEDAAAIFFQEAGGRIQSYSSRRWQKVRAGTPEQQSS